MHGCGQESVTAAQKGVKPGLCQELFSGVSTGGSTGLQSGELQEYTSCALALVQCLCAHTLFC